MATETVLGEEDKQMYAALIPLGGCSPIVYRNASFKLQVQNTLQQNQNPPKDQFLKGPKNKELQIPLPAVNFRSYNFGLSSCTLIHGGSEVWVSGNVEHAKKQIGAKSCILSLLRHQE